MKRPVGVRRVTRERRFRRALLFGLAGVVAVGLEVPANAGGIYKCTGPDGSTRYTSDRSHCPNAEKQVLKKEVQRIGSDRARRRPAPRPASVRGGGDGLEAMWKRKRPQAERDLRQAEKELTRMRNVIKSCNRGGEWYRTDESGIRQHIPCDELRKKLAEAQQRHDQLVHYLAEGLEDECRRASCQPGWVR